jgi:hypothetical protein
VKGAAAGLASALSAVSAEDPAAGERP